MTRRLLLLTGMLLFASASSFAFNARAASPWEPLVPGDAVTFLTPLLSAPSPIDTVIFSGGEVTESNMTGCATGVRSVQHYVILSPTGTRSEKHGGIVPVTALPLQPNTRLGSLTLLGGCSIGDVLYFRYEGTVE